MKLTTVAILSLVFIAVSSHENIVRFSVDSAKAAASTKTKVGFCQLAMVDCGSQVGKIVSVSFNGTCSSDKHAILHRGTVIVIDFEFQATNAETELTSYVAGKIGFLPWVSFKLDNPNACKNSGLTCPIQAGTTLSYKPQLDVLTEYPTVNNVQVRWEVKNKDSKDVFCVILPASIVD